jgi:hypothetical protein
MPGMDILLLPAAYLLLGLFAGVIAGLLGVGGGLVIVPILAWLYHLQGFDSVHLLQLAVGTSLATIVFTSLSSSLAHHRRGAVDWPVMVQLSLGIVAGAWFGGTLAVWLGGALLGVAFGVFELMVAAQMAFGFRPSVHRAAPGKTRNAIAGLLIGLLSALLGIGGGTLSVPWLVWHNIDMRRAVATSAACGFPIALVGALGFVAAGWQRADLPAGSTGFVYWPAVAMISLASVAAAPFGARLAHRLPQRRLRTIFAAFLVLLGVSMIGRSLSGS